MYHARLRFCLLSEFSAVWLIVTFGKWILHSTLALNLQHRFILFENLKFFCEKIVHFNNLGKSLLTQRYSILYIVGITKESWFHVYNYQTNMCDIAQICDIVIFTLLFVALIIIHTRYFAFTLSYVSCWDLKQF